VQNSAGGQITTHIGGFHSQRHVRARSFLGRSLRKAQRQERQADLRTLVGW